MIHKDFILVCCSWQNKKDLRISDIVIHRLRHSYMGPEVKKDKNKPQTLLHHEANRNTESGYIFHLIPYLSTQHLVLSPFGQVFINDECFYLPL